LSIDFDKQADKRPDFEAVPMIEQHRNIRVVFYNYGTFVALLGQVWDTCFGVYLYEINIYFYYI